MTARAAWGTPAGCLWAIVKPLLVLVTFGVLMAYAAFPWALPLPGRDRLDGNWFGEVRSSRGSRAWLLLSPEVSRHYRPRLGILSGRGTPVGGSATLCTARRRIEFEISGGTTVWSGAQFDILLRPVQPGPPELRLEIEGSWNGHTVEFARKNRSLADILSEPDDGPESSKFVSAQLRRGRQSDFDSACAKLTQS